MNYVIIDIETTGGSPKSSKITEIAMYKHDGVKIIDQYETLIDPEMQIPEFIVRLTGINDEMVDGAPKFHEVAKKICEMCEHLKIEFIQVRPTKTKTNSDYFKKITGYNKRTNQEQRDACLLIWGL